MVKVWLALALGKYDGLSKKKKPLVKVSWPSSSVMQVVEWSPTDPGICGLEVFSSTVRE